MTGNESQALELEQQVEYINSLLKTTSLTKASASIGIARKTLSGQFERAGYKLDKNIKQDIRINNNTNDPIIDAPEWVSFVVDNAIDYFGSWTANQLVLWTHGIDTPWYVSSMGGADLYKDVNDNLIANYFKKITTLGKDDPRPENGI